MQSQIKVKAWQELKVKSTESQNLQEFKIKSVRNQSLVRVKLQISLESKFGKNQNQENFQKCFQMGLKNWDPKIGRIIPLLTR